MAYEKRICVLKEMKKGFSADGAALSGAVYAERLGTALTLTPRILGIAPLREGRYALVFCAEGETFVFELKGRESIRLDPSPSIKAGFSVLLVFVRGDIEAVAFGSCGAAPSSHLPLLEAVSGGKRPIPNPLPPTELPAFSPNNVPLAPTTPLPEKEEEPPFRKGYDDEAIAASDYFRPSHENGVPQSGGAAQEEGQKTRGDEEAVPPFLRPKGTLTYYNTVREKLEKAFSSLPRDERLGKIFPHSEWVKEGEALLGVLYREGIPEYLCVAVEAKGEPPEEMKKICCFVPASHFSDEEGFYVVFQSADTGEYATLSSS